MDGGEERREEGGRLVGRAIREREPLAHEVGKRRKRRVAQAVRELARLVGEVQEVRGITQRPPRLLDAQGLRPRPLAARRERRAREQRVAEAEAPEEAVVALGLGERRLGLPSLRPLELSDPLLLLGCFSVVCASIYFASEMVEALQEKIERNNTAQIVRFVWRMQRNSAQVLDRFEQFARVRLLATGRSAPDVDFDDGGKGQEFYIFSPCTDCADCGMRCGDELVLPSPSPEPSRDPP